MKTLAKQNGNNSGRFLVYLLICVSALFFQLQKNEISSFKPKSDQENNNSEVSRIKSQPFTIIYIDHACAQTNQPSYTVDVKNDGSVIYTGRKNVAILGELKFTVPIDITTKLRRLFIEGDFIEMETLPYIMDYAIVSTSFRYGFDLPLETRIDYNNETPVKLIELRRTVEKALNITKYVNGIRGMNDLNEFEVSQSF